ncbi:MAG: putative 4-mercaptohistidine N1-methyltransferase [Paludibacter sp.]
MESETPLELHINEYETDREVANSCETNWGDAFTDANNFSKKLAKIAIESVGNKKKISVLDLNAETGRLAFELAQHFEKVTALDMSTRFIRMPIQLQEKGFIRYIVKDEGELVFYRDVVLSEMGLESGKENILFMQADANNLKPIYTGYDLIIVPNLLEELICPILFLKSIQERLNENGILIITSTYNWDGNETKRAHWPGGFKQDGEPLTSFEGIQTILDKHFTLENKPFDLALTLRKSSRIVEKHLTEVSVWKKK